MVRQYHNLQFFIDGAWRMPSTFQRLAVTDPSTEDIFLEIAMGNKEDIDYAISSARKAFPIFSNTSVNDRLELIKRILVIYEQRSEDLAQAVSQEMGAPLYFSRESQVDAGRRHLETMIAVLENFQFFERRGKTMVMKEPIGVCALITPWNWPLNQIVCKVIPALAAGCSMVLKPSEFSPLSALVFAEIMEEAGTPKGVFNLVNGSGSVVGQVMAQHPEVDMVSFTGSRRAGVEVARAASDTVKRVVQELGGKSSYIILPDADFKRSVGQCIQSCFSNSGQSCDAPTRMLVLEGHHGEAVEIAVAEASRFKVGNPYKQGTVLGPVANHMQFEKVQSFIKSGIDEGACLAIGGVGRPKGLERGYYVQPTIFGNVSCDMAIAREEIFGPVLSIIPYKNEDHAIDIAHDSLYGLAAYVQSEDIVHARQVAKRLRAGSVYINNPDWDLYAPFGGYKQSGNGRECADWGLESFLEIKAMIGYFNTSYEEEN
ncbi:Aldehyde dehydrogenase [Liberibacter crescens BT-1]|uniref:Aldehyde dehydrogenase n=1 Tax=Liberibacter crescens (strain BT-1) TaxID=1215343 RepID=L0EWS2_LIBCB|nr:aldehyde dehydrogenase family protein [Liberibacter crescens]AGA64831.1 Aldehyde dehydrogenase [Liberibacter crescens BT-1]AMC12886.1 aldehyde dehydrogenase [Liberibacter crescens]